MNNTYLHVEQEQDDVVSCRSACSSIGGWEPHNEDFDISPEHSENEADSLLYSGSEEEDDEPDEALSPLDLVLSIVLDEQLQNDEPTTTETVDPWHAMNALREAHEPTHAEPLTLDEEEDLYSLYVMANSSGADGLTQEVETQEQEEWTDMQAIAQMALHHHSPYDSLAGSKSISTNFAQEEKPDRQATPTSSLDHRDWQEIEADMNNEELDEQSTTEQAPPQALHPEKPPASPPTRRAPQRLRRQNAPAATTTTTTTTTRTSSGRPLSGRHEPILVSGQQTQRTGIFPAPPPAAMSAKAQEAIALTQRIPGVGINSLLQGKKRTQQRRASGAEQAYELLGLKANETEAARRKRDEVVAKQMQAARERELIFHEVMRNLNMEKPSAPVGVLPQQPPTSRTPPPALRRVGSLRRSTGSAATLKGEKVKLVPLVPNTAAASSSSSAMEAPRGPLC